MTGRAFESLSYQWIEDFKMVARDIECREYHGSTVSEELVENYKKILIKWNIQGKQRVYVVPNGAKAYQANCTTDTDSKMNKFGILLEAKHDICHEYCMDHVLQATAVIAYSYKLYGDKLPKEHVSTDSEGNTIKLGDGLLGKCRKLCQLFNSSTQKQQDLHSAQHELGNRETDPVNEYKGREPLDVVQDVVVRWWSTYSMVSRLIILRPAFKHLEAEGKLKLSNDSVGTPSRLPTDAEWAILESLALLLEPWKDAQKLLESQYIVTS